jgi:pimeloyl-ACP methyl ester carboxylesterase
MEGDRSMPRRRPGGRVSDVKTRTSIQSCLALFLLTFSPAFAAEDPVRIVTLEARAASIEDGIRLLENPDRLGFAELHRRAAWRLEDIPPGSYALDLIYASGSGRQGQYVGSIQVEVGKARFTVPINATGGWDKTRIVSIEKVAINEGSANLAVRVAHRATGIHTVLDLWYADLIPWKPQTEEAGKVLRLRTRHGRYVQYIPRTLREPAAVLLLVHGTPGSEETALEVAEDFAAGFISIAKRKGLILLAPAFDQRNFGGRAGPGGGYRGLFGREIGADEFVNEIVARSEASVPTFDGTFYLYGHSAGGQFVSRYAVLHPGRLRAAVISAAGSYAFPNPQAAWADGMLPLQRMMAWDGDVESKAVDIRPDPNGWLEAAQLPITVLVGDGDDTEMFQSPTQKGTSMKDRARCWVEQMNALAESHGKVGRVRLVIAPAAGHDSRELLRTGITALFGE